MMKSRLEFELDYMTEIANLLIDEGILKKHKGISILTIHLVHSPNNLEHVLSFSDKCIYILNLFRDPD